jgi:hypothetical protein
MNKKIFLMFLFIILSFTGIYAETTQVIGNSVGGINYDFLSNQSYNYLSMGPYQNNLLMLRVVTSQEATCLFGRSPFSLGDFEGRYGTRNEQILNDLEDGINKYYIRCQNNSLVGMVNEVVFSVNIPIEGNIKISEKEPPLKEGQYEIILTTSKESLDTPELKYTLDGITYKQIQLKGSGSSWQGYLIIPRDIGEGVGYFTFKARDLYGGEGTKITGDNLFILDTIKPETVEIINAIGYEGQIKLNWFYNSDVKEFNIYKSENPQAQYTDFYKTSSKNYFTDNNVEKGKTYYYRVAGVDEAGNIGDLSKEVYATSLYSNSSGIQSGLDIKLIGKVDNLISEIDNLVIDIGEINSALNSKGEKEKTLFTDLKLNKEIDNSLLELNAIKRDVVQYKMQDLTENELNNKLSSASLRINIVKKKIPENIAILNEKSINREINEENIQKAFLEYAPTQEPSKKEIQNTLDISKEKRINLTSTYYGVEIIYLDGSKKEITVVKDYLDSQIETLDGFFYIMILPKDIVQKVSDLTIMNSNYEIIKEDPVLSFNSDTKRITYYFNKEVDLDSLGSILISPIQITTATSKVTGNVITNYINKDSLGLIILIVFVGLLLVYFLVLKKGSKIKLSEIILGEIDNIEKLLKENKKEEAKESYLKLKEDYKKLSNKDKERVILEINKLNETLIK